MKRKFVVVLSVTVIMLTGLIGLTQAQADELQSSAAPQIAVGTGFTYQGQLKKNSNPINDTCDFRFILYTADIGGSQVGPIVNKSSVGVSNGLFTVNLDFGSGAFTGEARWLDIAVRCPAGTGSFSALTPRQVLTPAPYALALPGLWTQQNDTSPNIIGGRFNNTVTVGVYGATIGGGGAATDEDFGNPVPNRVTDHYGTVGGGVGNQAGNGTSPLTDTMYATVGGGRVNLASGWESVVGGGAWNTVSGTYATIAGGLRNVAGGHSATVAGGSGNSANNSGASVGGGYTNVASGDGAVIGGGNTNTASGGSATVGGGQDNSAISEVTTISGGHDNIASLKGDTVGGGGNNTVNGAYATVSGGYSNTVISNGAAIGGGEGNIASSDKATIGGGEENFASGPHAFVGGGYQNIADQASAVAGGTNNMASSKGFVGAGGGNTANGGHASIGGGEGNSADGYAAAIPGGRSNLAAGNYSFAAGNQAKANHHGAFVWGDSTNADIHSSGDNQFIVRANGGVWIGRATSNFTPTIGANVFISTSTGAYLSNGGAWTNSSDRNAKENWIPVDGRNVLARLAAVPIATWNYQAQDASVQHIGPAAQDFHAAFGVGEDNAHISTIDADGVALAAIQGLNQIVQEKDAQIAALEARVSALEQHLDAGPIDYAPYAIVGGLLAIGLLITRRRQAGGAA